MKKYFSFGIDETVLFRFWRTTDYTSFLLTCFIILILSLSYSLVKVLREKYFIYIRYNNHNSVQNTVNFLPLMQINIEQTVDDVRVKKPKSVIADSIKFMIPESHILLSKYHVFDTFLYIIQYIIIFLMMLVSMTFNLWFNLILIIGLTIGYYIFDSRKMHSNNSMIRI